MIRTIEAIVQPVIVIGVTKRVTVANAAAQQLFGSGMANRHFVTALRQPVLLECIEAADATGASTAIWSTTLAGRDALYQVDARRVELSDGQGTVVSFTDISDVQEAETLRSEFVANVSHELKTPLTAVLGLIETLQGSAKDDRDAQQRFLAIMEAEARRMDGLVSGLLSLSRVEAEGRRRPTGQADLARLVKDVASVLEPLAAQAQVALHIDFPEDQSADIPGDAEQLRQVVSNLVENALKYAGPGAEVTVRLRFEAKNSDLLAPAAALSVTDTGKGFDPVHIPRLTERFYRIDSHRSREQGGTGLGLAIVKHIVNRHRGRLKITTKPGQGSEFTVILPS